MVGIIRYTKCKAKTLNGLRKIQIKNNLDIEEEREKEWSWSSHKKLPGWGGIYD